MTEPRFLEILRKLERLRATPEAVLDAVVRRDGLCLWAVPPVPDEPMTDRELAALHCAGCPVQDECLESELRTAGPRTVGVWGAMPEDDRRALHPLWHRTRRRVTS